MEDKSDLTVESIFIIASTGICVDCSGWLQYNIGTSYQSGFVTLNLHAPGHVRKTRTRLWVQNKIHILS